MNKFTKLVFMLPISVFLLLACSWEIPLTLPATATALAPAKKPEQISISTQIPNFAMVVAEKGLRLRDLPDAAGPDDSTTIVIMPDGSPFAVEKCEKFNGQWWAYGSYEGREGWASARYLKNGCEEE